MIELGVPEKELRVSKMGKAAKLLDGPIENIELLGSREKLNWKQEDEALTISAPRDVPAEEALVYRVRVKA